MFDIAPTLEAIGCYRWRDEAIRNVFPEYGDGWKNKIVISGGLEGRVNHFQLVVQTLPRPARRSPPPPLRLAARRGSIALFLAQNRAFCQKLFSSASIRLSDPPPIG